jgi:hypothetical protein
MLNDNYSAARSGLAISATLPLPTPDPEDPWPLRRSEETDGRADEAVKDKGMPGGALRGQLDSYTYIHIGLVSCRMFGYPHRLILDHRMR